MTKMYQPCQGTAPQPAQPVDKALVRRRFARAVPTYDAQAKVQAAMARHLCSLLPTRHYGAVLEIGCGTGLLTREVAEKLSFSSYTANDLVPECGVGLQALLPQARFIAGDMDSLALAGGYDLVLANASLQWSHALPALLDRLYAALAVGGLLAFSLFGQRNLWQIREYFGVGLAGLPLEAVGGLVQGRLLHLEEEEQECCFDSPLAVLRHLQQTGVNAVGGSVAVLSPAALRRFDQEYRARYACRLTYQPQYIVLCKIA
jgi:malonyl-CoA O-methyltransferase